MEKSSWKYDDDDVGGWVMGDLTFIDNNCAFKFKGNEVPVASVGKETRDNLVTSAKMGISKVLAGAMVINPIKKKVNIDVCFEQGKGVTEVFELRQDKNFGSYGARTCLIVFAVGKTEGGKVMAVGGHFDTEVHKEPCETVVTMIDNLEKSGVVRKTIEFFIFGGEKGHITDPSNKNLIMDYPSYYPFFFNIQEQGVPITRHNFPSNPDGTTEAGATISLASDGKSVDVQLWVVPSMK